MNAQSTRFAVALLMLAALASCSAESPADPTGLEPQFSHLPLGPNFGAKASGNELATPGIVQDGGPGSTSASISEANFNADASFPAVVTFLPELRAFSQNSTASNDDDLTNTSAEAYQVFTSSATQTITLDVDLHAVVIDNTTDRSFVLADVFVYGGSEFEVIESPICENGRLGKFMFDGTYFCGSRLGWSNLFIPVGDVTLPDALSFAVGAGETFGVYAILRAASSGGSADATNTLSLDFTDDQFISAVDFSGSGPIEVEVDLKPGNDQPCINLKSKGVVPVGIFGSDVFDVTQIDPATLSFGGLGVRMLGNGAPSCSLRDANDDEFEDLVCRFEMDADSWVDEEGVATLTGALFDGTEITGTDEVCFVPKPRR